MELYNVMGENTLTGNTWVCSDKPMRRADAQELRDGYKRLEPDYKIGYYIELAR